jgi:riboflavin kinase/FMN adenylyltransferase
LIGRYNARINTPEGIASHAMELIRGLHNLRARHRGCVATIGNYDGVHRGHQAVLGRLAAEARKHGLPATVMIFEPMPREFFAPDKAPPRISSLREKLEDLDAAGADRVLCVRFDARFAGLSPQAFVTNVLVDGLGVRYLEVGDDFRFGHHREGDFRLLQEAGRKQGFEVEHLPAFCLDGERVSSTRVREALVAGDMPQAARLLGRPYRIDGRVVGGRRLGRELGVPTANLALHQRRAIRYGVYVARVDTAAGRALPAAVNIGVRPSVPGTDCLLEAHLLDYAGDLYGQRIRVHLLQFLRGEARFADLEELRERMEQDIAQARAWLRDNE